MSKRPTSIDLYSVLGVSSDADSGAVQKAFRKVARRFHPDNNQHPNAAREFARVRAAYDVLGNAQRRAQYDAAWTPTRKVPFFQVELVPSRTQLFVSNEPQAVYLQMLVHASQSTALKKGTAPLNLCLVVDRSTSMKNGRLDQVKLAAREIIERLHPSDTFSVVTFSDRAEVVLPASQNIKKSMAISRVSTIQASGGTEILQGLIMGLTELHRNRDPRAINHMVLLTDGQTYGDENSAFTLAERAEKDGITISGMGIGADWNDAFLDRLTGLTGGQASFIADQHGVTRHVREHVFGLGDIYAARMRLDITPDRDITVEQAFQLRPDPMPIDLNVQPLRLGPLERREPLAILLKFVIPAQTPSEHLVNIARLSLQGDVLSVGQMGETTVFDLSLGLADAATAPPPPPAMLVDALEKVNLYNIQKRAASEAANGDVAEAADHLQHLATRLLASGETQLAQQALREAQNLQMTHRLSTTGQKSLKYGTRALLLGPSSD